MKNYKEKSHLNDLRDFIKGEPSDVNMMADSEIEEELHKAGIDITQHYSKLMREIRIQRQNARLSQVRESRERDVARVDKRRCELRGSIRHGGREAILNKVTESFSTPQAAEVFFQKFTTASDEELVDILIDSEILDEIDLETDDESNT